MDIDTSNFYKALDGLGVSVLDSDYMKEGVRKEQIYAVSLLLNNSYKKILIGLISSSISNGLFKVEIKSIIYKR